jgi:hypothetical protein
MTQAAALFLAESGASLFGMPRDEAEQRLINAALSLERMESRRRENNSAETHGVNLILKEIQGLRTEVTAEITDLREDVKGVKARLSLVETGRRIGASTPPGGYSSGGYELDLSAASKSGSISLEKVKEAWASKLVELDSQVQTLQEKAAAEAIAKKQALKDAEEYRKKWTFRVKIAATVAIPVLPILGAFLNKLLHLL